MPSSSRPHIVCLGAPKFAGGDYLADFSKDFDFEVLDATNHEETKAKLPQLIAANGPVDAFMVRMGTPPYEPFSEELLKPLLPSCKIIASASAGFNEFPVQWLAQNGIVFTNTVDAVAEATADMAMFLILATLRNATAAERSAKAGTWKSAPGLVPARDPSGLTLGIVGMGAIGKYLAKKAHAFNMEIKYYNRRQLSPSLENQYNATYCSSLHELLSSSDVVSINCPLNDATTNLISVAEFAAMRDGAFFINTARGAVVDESALKLALDSGKVARAGLDVLCNEPNVDEWFLKSEKVIVQPHLGGLTDMAFQRAERECFENLKAFFATGQAHSAVNLEYFTRG